MTNELLQKAQNKTGEALRRKNTLETWVLVGVVSMSFLLGSLYVHQTTDFNVVKKTSEKYSFSADEVCKSFYGCDHGYGFSSNQYTVDCSCGEFDFGKTLSTIRDESTRYKLDSDGEQ